MRPDLVIGPRLRVLLRAQGADDDATVHVRRYADRMIALLGQLDGSPLIWPVGRGAERLAGAVAALGPADVEVLTWGADLKDRHVLLLSTVSVSTAELELAAGHAVRLGAARLSAAVIDCGTPHPVIGDVDTVFLLGDDPVTNALAG